MRAFHFGRSPTDEVQDAITEMLKTYPGTDLSGLTEEARKSRDKWDETLLANKTTLNSWLDVVNSNYTVAQARLRDATTQSKLSESQRDSVVRALLNGEWARRAEALPMKRDLAPLLEAYRSANAPSHDTESEAEEAEDAWHRMLEVQIPTLVAWSKLYEASEAVALHAVRLAADDMRMDKRTRGYIQSALSEGEWLDLARGGATQAYDQPSSQGGESATKSDGQDSVRQELQLAGGARDPDSEEDSRVHVLSWLQGVSAELTSA